MQEIKIYSSKKKSVLLLFGSLLFVIGGIFIFANSEKDEVVIKIVGIIGILFFGLGVGVSIWTLFQDRLMLIITEKGVNVNPRKKPDDFVEWKDIRAFTEMSIHSTKIIIMEVKDPQKWIDEETNAIRKKMMEFSTNNYRSPFNFSANAMRISHKELLHLLNENLEKYRLD